MLDMEGLVPTESQILAAGGGAHWEARTETGLGAEEPGRGKEGAEHAGAAGAEHRGTGSLQHHVQHPTGPLLLSAASKARTQGWAERFGPTDPEWCKRTALWAEGK